MHKEKSQQRLMREKRNENQPVSRSKTSGIKVGVSSSYRVMKATTGYRVRTEKETSFLEDLKVASLCSPCFLVSIEHLIKQIFSVN